MVELQLLRGDEVVHTRAIGRAALHVGRAPTNDLVLADKQVSSRHAVLWVEGDQIRLEDLGSRNGTFVNDTPIKGVVALTDGDRVRLGGATVLRVLGRPGDEPTHRLGSWLVEDLAAGVRMPVRSDRFRFGAAPDAEWRLPDGPARAAALLVYEDGEVRLATDEDDRRIEPGDLFAIGGREFALREASDEVSRTEGMEATRYPYRLEARLDGAIGPEALVIDVASGLRHRIDTENRATLLYLLARQARLDRDSGRSESDAGWCEDEEVAMGIWGRGRDRNDPNNFHVLVCRVRKELKDAGFDPWFIEKRKRHIRVRVPDVALDGDPSNGKPSW